MMSWSFSTEVYGAIVEYVRAGKAGSREDYVYALRSFVDYPVGEVERMSVTEPERLWELVAEEVDKDRSCSNDFSSICLDKQGYRMFSLDLVMNWWAKESSYR